MQIGFQNGLLLGAFVLVLLAQAYDRAKRGDVIPIPLGLRIDVADVAGNSLLLFFEMFDAFDDCLALILCEACGRAVLTLVLDVGGCGGDRHDPLLALASPRSPPPHAREWRE